MGLMSDVKYFLSQQYIQVKKESFIKDNGETY